MRLIEVKLGLFIICCMLVAFTGNIELFEIRLGLVKQG